MILMRAKSTVTGRLRGGPETVPVPRRLLARRGWTKLVADDPEEGSFRELLAELRRGEGVHSWRWLAPRGGAAGLLAAEARLRPGRVYAYYGVRRDGSRELAAAAAVADRVSRDFPHDGFPVIARAFVRPAFRGEGLYAALLEHRVRVCLRAFGAGLQAVHLGTANPRIRRAALAGAGGVRFVPIGVEALGAGRHRTQVRDFAAFAPGYARRLRAACARDPRLSRLVSRLLSRGFDPRGYDRLVRARALAAGSTPELDRLLDLFAAIPVVRVPPA